MHAAEKHETEGEDEAENDMNLETKSQLNTVGFLRTQGQEANVLEVKSSIFNKSRSENQFDFSHRII